MHIKTIIKKKLIISNNHKLLKNWKNINGPVCFKVPPWIKNPLGKYYLIFSDHQGSYLRLAYADSMNSDWTIYKTKILEIKKLNKILYDHIASPDIYIDNFHKQICLYFHSRSRKYGREQLTFVALSKNGINYRIKSLDPIAPFYFRIFSYKRNYYGLSKGGDLFKSKNKFLKFKFIKNIFNRYNDKYHNQIGSVRHLCLLKKKNYLEIFYTKIGDKPERIYQGILKLFKDERNWNVKSQKEILRPTKVYEGSEIKVRISRSGPSKKIENALRDPYVIVDKINTYLLYCVKGEKGIALAKIIYK